MIEIQLGFFIFLLIMSFLAGGIAVSLALLWPRKK